MSTQRKGQLLFNALRPKDSGITTLTDYSLLKYRAEIADKLFNLSDSEFDQILAGSKTIKVTEGSLQ